MVANISNINTANVFSLHKDKTASIKSSRSPIGQFWSTKLHLFSFLSRFFWPSSLTEFRQTTHLFWFPVCLSFVSELCI